MILKGWIPALGLFVLTSILSGCAIFDADHPPEHHACVDDVIRVGDTLAISLLDIPEPKMDSYLVGSDGTINLSLLGSLVATNKKFGVFEKEIQKAYLDQKMYRQIKVVVKPGDRFYTVGGEVNAKGRQIYVGQTTVLRAIVSCGDFTEFANRRKWKSFAPMAHGKSWTASRPAEIQRYDRPICPGRRDLRSAEFVISASHPFRPTGGQRYRRPQFSFCGRPRSLALVCRWMSQACGTGICKSNSSATAVLPSPCNPMRWRSSTATPWKPARCAMEI